MMTSELITELRRVGCTQKGTLETEDGTVWHPANLLLMAANEVERLTLYVESTKTLFDELLKHKRVAEQLYADMYAMKSVLEALTDKKIHGLKGMKEWEEHHVFQ